MESNEVVVLMVVVFSFLGGLALLTFSASAIKLYYREVELLNLDKEQQEKLKKKEMSTASRDNPASTEKNATKQEPIEVS